MDKRCLLFLPPQKINKEKVSRYTSPKRKLSQFETSKMNIALQKNHGIFWGFPAVCFSGFSIGFVSCQIEVDFANGEPPSKTDSKKTMLNVLPNIRDQNLPNEYTIRECKVISTKKQSGLVYPPGN